MEPNINEKNKEMYFVAKKLTMPLFLLSRNRIKYNRIEPMWNYIANNRLGYTNTCNEENVMETATTKKQKKICGYKVPHRAKPCTQRPLKYSRDLITIKPWQLPPNRYDVLKVPFNNLRGAYGAYIAKSHKHKPLHPTKGFLKQSWKFYELGREMERMQKRCNQKKGLFITNARDRRATSRCMISSPLTCYHDPNAPAPNSYYPRNHFLKIAPKKKTKPPNPHIFLRKSCVPAKKNSIHRQHISFAPGPARYENRFPNMCPCFATRNKRKLKYQPGIQLMIERQKRLKFRRQKYIKIKLKGYCSPDWRHVAGGGHTYLFKNIPPKPHEKPRLKTTKDAKKTERELKLYPDARYIGMINDPPHQFISKRMEPLPVRPVRVTFNCMTRRILRRQLRNNKKIAFNSGQERFRDVERPPPLTASEQEANKLLLPIERQLRDYPIMTRPLSQIKGKLLVTPAHLKAISEFKLRKRNFKFLPLPTAKVLVTEADLKGGAGENVISAAYFRKELNVMDYLKDTLDPKDLQEITEYKALKRI